MSAFSDAFRELARRPGARIACAVEYDFPIAGRRRYSAAPILDYHQNVVAWGSLRRVVDERSAQIQLVEFDVTHANTDRDLEAILEGEDVHGAAAVVRYVTPDLPEHDWPVRFSGRIERYEYALGIVRVILRTDDAVLRNTRVPRRKMIREEYPTMPADNEDRPLPIVYGIYNSSGIITDPKAKPGLLPGVRYIGASGEPGWFIFALGILRHEGMVIYPAAATKELQYGVHNGIQATHVRYDTAVDDDEARIDAAGYDAGMLGDFDPTTRTMLNPVDQMRHFLAHFVYGDWRVGGTAAGPLSDYTLDAAPIDRKLWGKVRDFIDAIHLEGSLHVATERRAQDFVNDWLRANPLLRIFWRHDGTLGICAFPGEWPGLPTSSSHRIVLDWDDVGRTFQTKADTSGIAKRVLVSYHPNPATGGTEAEATIEDTHQLDDVTVTLDMNFTTARAAIPSPDTVVLGYPYQTPYTGNLTGVVALRMYPTSSDCSFVLSDRHGPGTQPAAGAWTLVTSGEACGPSVTDPAESLDPTRYSSVRLHPTSRFSGQWLWSFGPPPSRVSVAKVRLRACVRVSSSDGIGADQPFALTGFVRIAGVTYYASAATPVSNYTVSRATDPASVEQFTFQTFGEWTTNPATSAAWTTADLGNVAFEAGLAAIGDGLPTSAGASTTVDVGSCWLEILGTPTYAAVDGILAAASRSLRLFRSQVTTMSLTAQLEHADLEPGDFVYVSGQRYPSPGAEPVTLAAWDARPMFVRSVVEQPGTLTAQLDLLDLRYATPSLWATFRSAGRDGQPLGGSPYFDRGAGWSLQARTVATACHREPDFRMVIPSGPRVTPWGLAVNGCADGEVVWLGLNNTFSLGSGGSFDYWTITRNGACAIGDSYADETYLIDNDDYRRSVYVNNNGTTSADWGYLSQSVTVGSTSYDNRMRFGLKVYTRGPAYDEAAPGTIHVAIRMGSTSWVPGSGWTSGWTWVPLTNTGNGTYGRGSLATFGDHVEWWSDEVDPGDAGGTIDYHVGYCTQPGAVFWILAAPIVHNGGAVLARALRNEFVPTKASAVVQQSDVFRIENPSGRPVWDPQRGTAILTFVPMWDHADLNTSVARTLLLALHNETAGSESYDAITYFRNDAVGGEIRFERFLNGTRIARAIYTLALSQLATYMRPIKVAARWTSDDGELGLAAYTFSVFHDGERGTDEAASDPPPELQDGTLTPALYPGVMIFNGSISGEARQSYADGYIADLEVYPHCLRDDEIVRLQRGLRYPTPSATAFAADLSLSVAILPAAGAVVGRAGAVGQAREAALFPAGRAGAGGGALVATSPTVIAHSAGASAGRGRDAVPHAASRAGATVGTRAAGVSLSVSAGRARATGAAAAAVTEMAGRAGAAGAALTAIATGGTVVSGRAPAAGRAASATASIT